MKQRHTKETRQKKGGGQFQNFEITIKYILLKVSRMDLRGKKKKKGSILLPPQQMKTLLNLRQVPFLYKL